MGARGCLLGGQDFHKAWREVVELEGRGDVLVQRHAVELCEHVNAANPGVQAVANRDIDETVFTTQRDGWLRSLFRQREESGAGSSTHDDGQGGLDGDSGCNVAHKESRFCVALNQLSRSLGCIKSRALCRPPFSRFKRRRESRRGAFWRARRGRVSSRSFHQPNVLEDEHAFAFDAPESAIGRPPTRSICGRRSLNSSRQNLLFERRILGPSSRCGSFRSRTFEVRG